MVLLFSTIVARLYSISCSCSRSGNTGEVGGRGGGRGGGMMRKYKVKSVALGTKLQVKVLMVKKQQQNSYVMRHIDHCTLRSHGEILNLYPLSLSIIWPKS